MIHGAETLIVEKNRSDIQFVNTSRQKWKTVNKVNRLAAIQVNSKLSVSFDQQIRNSLSIIIAQTLYESRIADLEVGKKLL